MLQMFRRKPKASLPSVRFNDGGTERVIFTLPPTERPDLQSVVVLAMPKSGSVMLDGIMRMLCKHVGLSYVSIMQEAFTIGLPTASIPAETSDIFLPCGYCFGGFRNLPPTFSIPILDTARPVLLMRDPRDMLVSHYYSLRDSHPEPGKALKSAKISFSMRDLARSLDIDDYVKATPASTFRQYMSEYRTKVCERFDTRVYRYEDVIYKKPEWVCDLVEHFGWAVPTDLAKNIGEHFNIIPERETEAQHIRQVHPGNFRKKLKPDTIAWLDDFFAEEMAFFGYNLNG